MDRCVDWRLMASTQTASDCHAGQKNTSTFTLRCFILQVVKTAREPAHSLSQTHVTTASKAKPARFASFFTCNASTFNKKGPVYFTEEEEWLATGRKVSLSAVRQDATDSHLSPVAVPRGPTQLILLSGTCRCGLPQLWSVVVIIAWWCWRASQQ